MFVVDGRIVILLNARSLSTDRWLYLIVIKLSEQYAMSIYV